MLNSKLKNDPSNIGASLRRKRKELGMTMQQVADAAGLSTGFISQVERGLTAPSLSSLTILSDVLQTHISAFLDQPKPDVVTRQTSRQPYTVPGSGTDYERVSSSFEGSKLHSVIVHERPGHRVEPISHSGEEMFYVISGALTIEIEGKVEILNQGDSLHFDSTKTHTCWNHTNGITSLLWCGTLNIFGDAPSPIHLVSALNASAIQPHQS